MHSLKNIEKLRYLVHSVRHVSFRIMAVQLNLDKQIVKFGPNIGWVLHHDNAPTHKKLSVKQFSTQNRLLKWNTHLVPLILLRMILVISKMKSALKGRIFQDAQDTDKK
jgi:hypothetical protein